MPSQALFFAADLYKPPLSPLRFAVKDAMELRELFKRNLGYGDAAVYLPPDTTHDGIFAALDRQLSLLEPGDTQIIYFAGHGVEDANTGKQYLLLGNANPKLLVDGMIEGAPGVVSVETLVHATSGYPGVHRVMIFDACREELGARGLGGSRSTLAAEPAADQLAFGSEEALNKLVRDAVAREAELAATARNAGLRPMRQGKTSPEVALAHPPVMLKACHMRQKAYELPEEQRGAFSLAIERALLDAVRERRVVATTAEFLQGIAEVTNQAAIDAGHTAGQQPWMNENAVAAVLYRPPPRAVLTPNDKARLVRQLTEQFDHCLVEGAYDEPTEDCAALALQQLRDDELLPPDQLEELTQRLHDAPRIQNARRVHTEAAWNLLETAARHPGTRALAVREATQLREEARQAYLQLTHGGRSPSADECDAFLADHPGSRHTDVVQTLRSNTLDNAAWALAQQANTIAGYEAYRQTFPQGRFHTSAGEGIARVSDALAAEVAHFEALGTDPDVAACDHFDRQHPGSPRFAAQVAKLRAAARQRQADQDAAWAAAQAGREAEERAAAQAAAQASAEAAKRAADERAAAEAVADLARRQAAEKLAAENAQRDAEAAAAKQAALEAAERKTAAQRHDTAWAKACQAKSDQREAVFRKFARDFPDSPHCADAVARAATAKRHDDDWALAQRLGTESALGDFIDKHPDSDHVAEAQSRRATLETTRKAIEDAVRKANQKAAEDAARARADALAREAADHKALLAAPVATASARRSAIQRCDAYLAEFGGNAAHAAHVEQVRQLRAAWLQRAGPSATAKGLMAGTGVAVGVVALVVWLNSPAPALEAPAPASTLPQPSQAQGLPTAGPVAPPPATRSPAQELADYTALRGKVVGTAWWTKGQGTAPAEASVMVAEAVRLASQGVLAAQLDAFNALANGRGIGQDSAQSIRWGAAWLARAASDKSIKLAERSAVIDALDPLLRKAVKPNAGQRDWQPAMAALARVPPQTAPTEWWQGLIALCGIGGAEQQHGKDLLKQATRPPQGAQYPDPEFYAGKAKGRLSSNSPCQ